MDNLHCHNEIYMNFSHIPVLLHEAIDQEEPLHNIRIAVLRALTRHRFFTEDMLKATADWEPHMQQEEQKRRHEQFCEAHTDQLRDMAQEPHGISTIRKFLRENIPPLPDGIRERANLPLGRLLKYSVHRLASVCLRDREEEAARLWRREAGKFERDAAARERIADYWNNIPPERQRQLWEDIKKLLKERMESAEPGDDWITMDELVASDEAFEANRQRILRADGQELQLYLMILEKRLKFGDAYSGLELINEQDTIPMLHEKPDWEPDEERDQLIAALEEVTGTSFRQ